MKYNPKRFIYSVSKSVTRIEKLKNGITGEWKYFYRFTPPNYEKLYGVVYIETGYSLRIFLGTLNCTNKSNIRSNRSCG